MPKGTHEWEKFVTGKPSTMDLIGKKSVVLDTNAFLVNEMVMDLREINFFIEKLHGMAWCPVENEWYWTTNTDCNYLVHAKR